MPSPPNFTSTPGAALECAENLNSSRCPAQGTAASALTVYVYPSVCGVGVILNALNLVVLGRGKTQLRGSVAAYLTAIAAADLLTCLMFLPVGPGSRCPQCCGVKAADDFDNLAVFLSNMCLGTSNWLTVLLAADRWRAVRRADRPRLPSTGGEVWPKVLITGVCSLTLNLPLLEVIIKLMSDLGSLTYGWVHATFIRFIPFLLILFLNGALIRVLVQTRKRVAPLHLSQDVLERRRNQQTHITVTLIALGTNFIIGNIPQAFNDRQVYRSIREPSAIYKDEFALFRALANILELNSFAVPFLLYCILSRGYFTAFVQLVKGNKNTCFGRFIPNYGNLDGRAPNHTQVSSLAIGRRNVVVH